MARDQAQNDDNDSDNEDDDDDDDSSIDFAEMAQGMNAYNHMEEMIAKKGADNGNMDAVQTIEKLSEDWLLQADFMQKLVNMADQGNRRASLSGGFLNLAALTKPTEHAGISDHQGSLPNKIATYEISNPLASGLKLADGENNDKPASKKEEDGFNGQNISENINIKEGSALKIPGAQSFTPSRFSQDHKPDKSGNEL